VQFQFAQNFSGTYPSRKTRPACTATEPYLEACDSWIGGQNVSLQFVKLWSRWRLGLPQFWVTIVIIHIVTYTNKLLPPTMKRSPTDTTHNRKAIFSETQYYCCTALSDQKHL